MAMKYISMIRWDGAHGWLRKFKWEWSVHFMRSANYRSMFPDWEPRIIVCRNRFEARKWRNAINSNELIGKKQAVIKRRLVQANWEDYHDTFGWNAGCGKR